MPEKITKKSCCTPDLYLYFDLPGSPIAKILIHVESIVGSKTSRTDRFVGMVKIPKRNMESVRGILDILHPFSVGCFSPEGHERGFTIGNNNHRFMVFDSKK